ncbi:MAG: thrombospondin type 3 repeat-containing protein [Planctomycetota bacterium]
MKSINTRSFCVSLAAILVVSGARADITVECNSLAGVCLQAGQVFDVECFIESAIDQSLDVAFVDFACALSGVSGSAGSIDITGLSFDPDGVIGWGPSTAGVPHWSPIAEVFGLIDTCYVREESNDFFPIPVLPANTPRYYGTLQMEVSNFANGSFDLIVEALSVPPEISDYTIFIGGGPGIQLIPVSFIPFRLTVSNAVTSVACCMADSSCEMLNAPCCAEQGGVAQGPGTECDGDEDGDGVDAACGDVCFGYPNVDTDTDSICDSADNCPAVANANQADSDNDTVGDACDLCPGQNDLLDEDDNAVPDCRQNIPTVSTWGLVILALSLLTLGKVSGRRGRLT